MNVPAKPSPCGTEEGELLTYLAGRRKQVGVTEAAHLVGFGTCRTKTWFGRLVTWNLLKKVSARRWASTPEGRALAKRYQEWKQDPRNG